jgi:hypothetical protein
VNAAEVVQALRLIEPVRVMQLGPRYRAGRPEVSFPDGGRLVLVRRV